MFKNNDPDSAQWKIWNDRFLCEMKSIDTMSTDYIKIFGTLTTFDPALDREMYDEMVDRYLTIIEMVKYFNDGIDIYIKKPEDSKKIYILIQEHLENWTREMQIPFREEKAPVEELKIMDRFAETVFEHAQHYLVTALADTPFARSLKRDDRSVLSLLKPISQVENNDDMVILPKRESMSDIFSNSGAKLERKF